MVKRLAVLVLMLILLDLSVSGQGTSPDDGRVCNTFDVQEQGDGFIKYFYCCCDVGDLGDRWMYYNCFVEVWTISETEYYWWGGEQCTFDQMPR